MTAHAEELGVHVLYEPAQTEIEKKHRRILDGYITYNEVQVVKRSEYVEIRFAFLMNVIRIKSLGIEMTQREPFSVAVFIKNIHVRTVSADPLRIIVVIKLEKFRLGADAVILAHLRNISRAGHSLFVEVLFLFRKRQRDLQSHEEYVHDIHLKSVKIRIPDRIKAVLYCLFRRRTTAAFRRNKIRIVFFRKPGIRVFDLILQLVVSKLAELIPAS